MSGVLALLESVAKGYNTLGQLCDAYAKAGYDNDDMTVGGALRRLCRTGWPRKDALMVRCKERSKLAQHHGHVIWHYYLTALGVEYLTKHGTHCLPVNRVYDNTCCHLHLSDYECQSYYGQLLKHYTDHRNIGVDHDKALRIAFALRKKYGLRSKPVHPTLADINPYPNKMWNRVNPPYWATAKYITRVLKRRVPGFTWEKYNQHPVEWQHYARFAHELPDCYRTDPVGSLHTTIERYQRITGLTVTIAQYCEYHSYSGRGMLAWTQVQTDKDLYVPGLGEFDVQATAKELAEQDANSAWMDYGRLQSVYSLQHTGYDIPGWAYSTMERVPAFKDYVVRYWQHFKDNPQLRAKMHDLGRMMGAGSRYAPVYRLDPNLTPEQNLAAHKKACDAYNARHTR